MIPVLVQFDRFSQMSDGLVSDSPGFALRANGIALVTEWLSGQWDACYEPVVTGWTGCYAQPTTTWSLIANRGYG